MAPAPAPRLHPGRPLDVALPFDGERARLVGAAVPVAAALEDRLRVLPAGFRETPPGGWAAAAKLREESPQSRNSPRRRGLWARP